MKIAIYPGAFKPPHKGHFLVVKTLVNRPDIDKIIVAISSKERSGVTSEQSINVWDIYKKLLGSKVEFIIISGSPVSYVFDQIKNNPDNYYVAVFGKEDGSRFKYLTDIPNVEIFDSGNFEGLSATNFREAINSNNNELISEFLPKGITLDEFLNAFNKSKNNSLLENNIYENKFPLLKEFIKYCKEYLNLKSLPPLKISYDPMGAHNMRSFGGYDPNNKSIELNVSNRHQADMFRTLAHELCHYKQDLQNRLTPESGKTGHPHENEANAGAAIIMRNFAQMKPEMFILI